MYEKSKIQQRTIYINIVGFYYYFSFFFCRRRWTFHYFNHIRSRTKDNVISLRNVPIRTKAVASLRPVEFWNFDCFLLHWNARVVTNDNDVSCHRVHVLCYLDSQIQINVTYLFIPYLYLVLDYTAKEHCFNTVWKRRKRSVHIHGKTRNNFCPVQYFQGIIFLCNYF